jgi:predicted acetyltransferase
MVRLIAPSVRFHRSFLQAADEFLAADEEPYAGILMWQPDETFPGRSYQRSELDSVERFADMCAFVAADRFPGSPRPKGFVPCTTLWIVEDVTYSGRISLRHELTDFLLNWAGQIGYAIRPSARRRGYATTALKLMLPVAAGLDIDPALITCDVDNVGSRRVIEANGGVLEDTRAGKLRYWVRTRPTSNLDGVHVG